MAETRVRSPIGVALVAMVLAGLVTALVLSFVLEDDGQPEASVLTLAPLPGNGTVPQQSDLRGEPAPDFAFEPLRRRGRRRLRRVPGGATDRAQLLLQGLPPLRRGDA